MNFEELTAQAKEIETAMAQLVANYNVLQGQQLLVRAWLDKLSPSLATVVKSAIDAAEAIVDVAEDIVDMFDGDDGDDDEGEVAE